MKKTITTITLLLSLMITAQTEVGNILRSASDNPNQVAFTLGCCVGDPDNHPDTNEDYCTYKIYTVDTSLEAGGDIVFNADVTFRNCEVRIIGGGNLIVHTENGAVFNVGTDFCPATLVQDSGLYFGSMSEFNQTLGIKQYLKNNELPPNSTFIIYNTLGQVITKGNSNYFNLLSLNKGLYFIEVKGYKALKYMH